MIGEKLSLDTLMANNGVEVIGAAQRTIAFTVVAAAAEADYIEITATGHGLKKWQTVYIESGFYAGVYSVYKVPSSSKIWVKAEFGATGTGNLRLLAALNGAGFVVTENPTIVEFEPESPLIDVATIIARTFLPGDPVPIPFKKLRISAGNITVIRNNPKAELSYNRFDRSQADGAPPVLSTITVTDAADTLLVLTYTDLHNLDALRIPATTAFAVSGIASTPTINSVAINATLKTVTLTLSAAVVVTDVPLVTYTVPAANAIRDVNGNKAAGFVAHSVVNTVV
jgi:hypothetical protein